MIEIIRDYWPMLLVMLVSVLAIQATGWIKWQQGRLAGRAEVVREMGQRQRGERL